MFSSSLFVRLDELAETLSVSVVVVADASESVDGDVSGDAVLSKPDESSLFSFIRGLQKRKENLLLHAKTKYIALSPSQTQTDKSPL